jgi:hypothetical protein
MIEISRNWLVQGNYCWNPGLFKNDMWSVKPPRGWPPKRDGNLGSLSAAKSGASAAKNAWLVRP